MEKGYFAAAWGDITNSPGWKSKMLKLGLMMLVPIFGIIVVMGYLYGWAREIAWNVHRPLPEKIFGNEDGNLYRRGFFLLVISFVFALIPGLIQGVLSAMTGFTTAGAAYSHSMMGYAASSGLFLMLSLVSLLLYFAVQFFIYVGSMRTSLYNTLSSGFQCGKIWAMIRYDFKGLLRIFAMELIAALVISAVIMVFVFFFIMFGVFGAFAYSSGGGDGAIMTLFAMFGVFVLFVLMMIVSMALSVLVSALVARALGYWTRQFDVPNWGGQDDPLPFERAYAAQQAQQMQQGYQVQAQPQPYQVQPQQPQPEPQAYQLQQPSAPEQQAVEQQAAQQVEQQAEKQAAEQQASEAEPVQVVDQAEKADSPEETKENK